MRSPRGGLGSLPSNITLGIPSRMQAAGVDIDTRGSSVRLTQTLFVLMFIAESALICNKGGVFFFRTGRSVTEAPQFQFNFRLSSRWHRNARKGPYTLHPVSQQSPQSRNSSNICLVERRSFSTLEGGMSAASFLLSSFLQAVNAVMLWLVHVEKVPQASEHLCPAKLQTRCDICCACQSVCPFIPTDSGGSTSRAGLLPTPCVPILWCPRAMSPQQRVPPPPLPPPHSSPGPSPILSDLST